MTDIPAASIVALVVLAAYKDAILSEGNSSFVAMDTCWRFLVGLGCVPGVVALYFRLTVPETPRFTMDVVRDINYLTSLLDGKDALMYVRHPY